MSWAHVEIMNIVNMESESVVETQVFRGVATDWTVFINYDSNQNFRGTLARAASPNTDNCRAAIWPDKHQLRSFLLHRCHARTSKLYVLIKPLSMKNLTHSFVRAKSKDTTTVIDRLWHTCIIPRSHLPLQPGLTRVSPSVNAIRSEPNRASPVHFVIPGWSVSTRAACVMYANMPWSEPRMRNLTRERDSRIVHNLVTSRRR